MNPLIKINLGSGQKYLEGYINCDVVREIKADKYFDLDHIPYPFKDNTADEVLMDNVLEHVQDISKVLSEIYRILKDNGRLRMCPILKVMGLFKIQLINIFLPNILWIILPKILNITITLKSAFSYSVLNFFVAAKHCWAKYAILYHLRKY